MSKKNTSKTPPPQPRAETAPMPASATAALWERPVVASVLLALAVLAAYAVSIHNGFVFFDDDKAILYNRALQNPSLSKFFSGQNLGMFAPISWIAYWLGSLLSGQEAWGYHLLGMLLHAANAVLAYWVLYRLLERHWPAFFVAALFALHPMQVEAVSWAAALSTVLFAFFYLGSLLSYLNWKKSPTPVLYGLSLLAFLLACLSKSAAVTLPLVLLAVDAYRSGKWSGIQWLNKLPYFGFSVLFGAYTFVTRAQEGHDIEAASSAFSMLDRFWMVCQTLLFYPVKLLVPLGFSISYPFVKTDGLWSWEYYLAPLALLALGLLVWKKFGTRREVLLALGLYLLPLVVMLPFRTVGSFELRSDRYVYLSCLGVFLLLALALEQQKASLRNGVLVAAAGLLAFLTLAQTRVWKDGIALFQNCVQKTPEASLCQCNLAYSELLNLDFENSAYHYSQALKFDPSVVEAYNGRGQAYFQLKKIPEALDDFTNAIAGGISTPKLFLNRGKCLVMLSRPQEALPDLNKSLELEPKSPEAYYFRAVVHEKNKEPERALADYSMAIEQNPRYLEALVNRALIRVGQQQFAEAIEDYSRAIALNPRMEMIYNNRGYAYLKNGQPDKALADVNKAMEINPNYARAYQTRAVIYQQTGQTALMQADLQRVQRLQAGR